MSTTPPPLVADLTDGLKRLKMAAMRRLAPELLLTAKTQWWSSGCLRARRRRARCGISCNAGQMASRGKGREAAGLCLRLIIL